MSNFAEFSRQVDDWLGEVEHLAVGVARGLSVELYNHAVYHSPQYTGDFAANWRYSVGREDTTFVVGLGEEGGGADRYDARDEEGHLAKYDLDDGYRGGKRQGDPFAMSQAAALNMFKPAGFTRLGQPVYISVTAKHDHFYSWMIEESDLGEHVGNYSYHGTGKIEFRPGNYGGTAKRAMSDVKVKYLNDGVISRAEALALINTVIGEWPV